MSAQRSTKGESIQAEGYSVDYDGMNRYGLVLLFNALFFISSASAETVMVSLQNDDRSRYIVQERIELVSAMEEGMMEPFFDANHIVFNLGINIEENAVSPSDELVARVALSGGASFLLNVYVGDVPEPAADGPADNQEELNTLPPVQVRYTFIDLYRDRIITQGTLLTADLPPKKTANAMSACFTLGETAAIASLDAWSD